jgi:hypothetical protein
LPHFGPRIFGHDAHYRQTGRSCAGGGYLEKLPSRYVHIVFLLFFIRRFQTAFF